MLLNASHEFIRYISSVTSRLWMVPFLESKANRSMSGSHPDGSDNGFFRCPVQEEDSAASIIIRGKKIPAKLQDKSIDGFSVLIEPKHVRKLRVGPQWILKSGGEVTEVWAQWMFNAPDGRVQLGLRRLRDLTPQPKGLLVPDTPLLPKTHDEPRSIFSCGRSHRVLGLIAARHRRSTRNLRKNSNRAPNIYQSRQGWHA
jgi:hypothetical protein